jgi:hypothetical protein
MEVVDERDEWIANAITRIPVPELQPRLRLLVAASQRPRHRFRVVGGRASLGAAALLAVCLVGGGIAIARVMAPDGDPAQQADPATRHAVLSYRTSWGEAVTGWEASTPDGRDCAFFTRGDDSKFAPDQNGLGGFCPTDSATPGRKTLTLIAESVSAGDGYHILVRGADRGSNVATIKLLDGSTPVTSFVSANGLFVGEVPGAATAKGEMPTGGPYRIASYSAGGTEISAIDLADVVR